MARLLCPFGKSVVLAAAALCALPALAETVNRLAENKVPVAMVEVTRTPQHTEVQLRTQQALKGVCWYSKGPNSPYLLANGHRYRFLDGDNITACPTKKDYQAQEVMVLRFQPLDSQVREISLVEGEGGENQMVNPKSSGFTFWNFLHVGLR
jgi:hypothetical protein